VGNLRYPTGRAGVTAKTAYDYSDLKRARVLAVWILVGR